MTSTNKLEDIFSQFETVPIASASLAQVHKATLAKTGQEVAVKVQYPTLRVQTGFDLRVISFCLKVVAKLTAWYKFKGLNMVRFFNNFEDSILDVSQSFLNPLKNDHIGAQLPQRG